MYGYAYDPAGNPVERSENGRVSGFAYNGLNQYSAATRPDKTHVAGRLVRPLDVPVSVSVNGLPAEVNRVPNSATSNGNETLAWHLPNLPLLLGPNEYKVKVSDAAGNASEQSVLSTLAPPPVFAYDANGNMTSDGTFTYTWNDENRLVAAEPMAPSAGAQRVQYIYDYMGRRTVRQLFTFDLNANSYSLTATTRYAYQGWNCIYEETAETQTASLYFWGIDLSGTMQGAGGVGGLLGVWKSENGGSPDMHLVMYDGNGNVMQTLDSTTGTITAEFDYDPFGKTITHTGPFADSMPYRFSTKPVDEVTGLSYYGYRWYDAARGRWLNRDPIGENGGVNLYGFVFNDPPSERSFHEHY